MLITSRLKILLTVLLFLVAVQTVSPWSIFPLGTTFLWWGINLMVLIAIFRLKKDFYDAKSNHNLVIFLYLYWNIICIVRGVFIAENYWEWKNLFTMGFILLLPLTIYISANRLIVQLIFAQYIKYLLPAFVLFAVITDSLAWGVYLIPVSILILFIPLLTKKWQTMVIVIALFAATASLAARSNVIKFVVPMALCSLYYARPFVGKKMLSTIRILFLVLPMVLFVLGLTGQFNIFKISEYVEGDLTTTQSDGKQEDLTADTRTGLYIEVIASAIKNDYVLLGRTPARGNDSVIFGAEIEGLTNTGKLERYTNEVSILNVFTWTGLIGVILYFLIFMRATYLAIHKSNSWYMKILGVYIAFRWTYAWVEDFSRFDLSYILLWLLLGMCFSTSFRNMTNLEFKYWVRGIFDVRYRNATLKKTRVVKIENNAS